jgi:hypothetical protein
MLVSQLNFKTLKMEVFQKKDTIFLSRSGERFLPRISPPPSLRALSLFFADKRPKTTAFDYKAAL